MNKFVANPYFDAVVLGAGSSGMVSTSVLLNQGITNVLLLDEYEQLGGNHTSVNIGPYSFDIGSFFFQSDSPFVKHFPELLERYIPLHYSIARVTPQGKVAAYPFSLKQDVLFAGPVEWTRILSSLLYARCFSDPSANARQFAYYWLGRRFSERSGLTHYMTRFYGIGPEAIESIFAQKRMHWIAENASLKRLYRYCRPPKTPPKLQLIRPREGFVHLYEAVEKSIRQRGGEIRLGATIKSIHRHDADSFRLELADGTVFTKNLISTMPIDKVTALCGLPVEHDLNYVALTSLFYSHRGDRGFPQNILYNFTPEGRWKRLTMHSDFYGLAQDRAYFSLEVVTQSTEPDYEAADRDFRDHVRKHGLFSGDLSLEGARLTKNLYPVYLMGSTDASAAAIKQLNDFGILSFGKQGGFDYQPTTWVSAAVAEKALAVEAV